MKLELVNAGGSEIAYHIAVKIDDKEVGILYLKSEELDTLIKAVKFGAVGSDEIEFVNSAYVDEEDVEDLD